MLPLLTFLPPNASPKAQFDRCVQVVRQSEAYAVTADVATQDKTGRLVTSATLAVRSKSWATLHLSTPAESGHGAINWDCEVHGRTLRAYDPGRGAYASQTFQVTLPAAAGLQAQFGNMIPEPIKLLIAPDQLDRFFGRFTVLRGWQQTATDDETVWTYRKGDQSVRFGFAKATGRLLDWKITAGGSTTWKLSYPPLGTVPVLSIPVGATRLETLRLPPALPKIADPNVQSVVADSVHAYERAFRLSADVKVDNTHYRVWRDGASVEEVSPSGGWRYAHGSLTLWSKRGPVYSGLAPLGRARAYLVQLQADAEPLALALLTDENYAARLFTKDYAVAKVGTMTLDGEPLTLLQLTGPAVKFDLSLDGHGMIRRIDSSAFDSKGVLMAETVQTLRYGPLGAMPSPPNRPRRSLPKLKPGPKVSIRQAPAVRPGSK